MIFQGTDGSVRFPLGRCASSPDKSEEEENLLVRAWQRRVNLNRQLQTHTDTNSADNTVRVTGGGG